MTTTTAAAVLAGTRQVIAAVSLTTNSSFGAPVEGEEGSTYEHSRPRTFRVLPVSDIPNTNSASYTYRKLTMDIGIVYPTDSDSEAMQLADAPLFEAALRELSYALGALTSPVTDTHRAFIEGYGPSFVRTDFASGQRSMTLFRVSIEYKAR